MLEDLKLSENLGFEDLGLHGEIFSLITSEDAYDKGIWIKKQKNYQWEKIIALAVEGLSKSNDLTLGMMLTEALVNAFGLEGLEAGTRIIKNILERDFFPQEEEYRDRLFQWFDQKLPLIVFYDSVVQHFASTEKAALDLNQRLNSLLSIMQQFPFPVENFVQIIYRILSKNKHIKAQEEDADHSINDKLNHILKELGRLPQEDKNKLKELLMQNAVK